jgi:gas vesicle protein
MNKELTNSNLNGFITGLVIGGLIGAAAVLWLAPQSGKKTQEMIRKRAHQLQLKAESVGQDMQHSAQHASEEIRERVAEVQHEGKEWLDHQSETARTSVTKPVEPVKR